MYKTVSLLLIMTSSQSDDVVSQALYFRRLWIYTTKTLSECIAYASHLHRFGRYLTYACKPLRIWFSNSPKLTKKLIPIHILHYICETITFVLQTTI